MRNFSPVDQADARDILAALITPRTTIYTLEVHTTRSGMGHTVALFIADGDAVRPIAWNVAAFLGLPYDQDNRGVSRDGAGMDFCSDTVGRLSAALFGDYYTLKSSRL